MLTTVLVVGAWFVGVAALVFVLGSAVGRRLGAAAATQTTPAETVAGEDGRTHRRMVAE